MLPAEVHAELTQLLQALQSPDNGIRSQAEDHLANNWTVTRPEVLLMGLAEQIAASADAPVCFCSRSCFHVHHLPIYPHSRGMYVYASAYSVAHRNWEASGGGKLPKEETSALTFAHLPRNLVSLMLDQLLTDVCLIQLRSFAAVIFRRISSKSRKNDKNETVEIFISLSLDQATAIRQKLLETLVNESDRTVRNKISDAVADVARQYSENSQYKVHPHPLTQRY